MFFRLIWLNLVATSPRLSLESYYASEEDSQKSVDELELDEAAAASILLFSSYLIEESSSVCLESDDETGEDGWMYVDAPKLEDAAVIAFPLIVSHFLETSQPLGDENKETDEGSESMDIDKNSDDDSGAVNGEMEESKSMLFRANAALNDSYHYNNDDKQNYTEYEELSSEDKKSPLEDDLRDVVARLDERVAALTKENTALFRAKCQADEALADLRRDFDNASSEIERLSSDNAAFKSKLDRLDSLIAQQGAKATSPISSQIDNIITDDIKHISSKSESFCPATYEMSQNSEIYHSKKEFCEVVNDSKKQGSVALKIVHIDGFRLSKKSSPKAFVFFLERKYGFPASNIKNVSFITKKRVECVIDAASFTELERVLSSAGCNLFVSCSLNVGKSFTRVQNKITTSVKLLRLSLHKRIVDLLEDHMTDGTKSWIPSSSPVLTSMSPF